MNTSRRRWLKRSAALGALPVSSLFQVGCSESDESEGGLRLGLAAYSFRNYFRYMRGKENGRFDAASEEMTMLKFIEFCAEHGVAAELTSYFFPPEVEDAYLQECRDLAEKLGVAIAGTAVGNNFSYPKDAPERAEQMAYVKAWVDKAAILGAPHVRVFAGKHPKGVSEEEAEGNAIEALKEAGDYAKEKGVYLGIENHDSIGSADRLLRIIKAVDHPHVGVNLDSGNFRTDDPYADMVASAPYSVNVQLKTELSVAGQKQPADQERIIGILKESGYDGFVVLEYEEDKNPYEHVPPLLGELKALCSG